MTNLIRATTVNEALPLGVNQVLRSGYHESTRNGPAYVNNGTLVTDYLNPEFKVLFYPGREANPFFHLTESIWMLAGSNRIQMPNHYVGTMKNFSVDGLTFNAAYGHRWRRNWNIRPVDSLVPDESTDQLQAVIEKLVKSPNTRQAVIGIWDPAKDLYDTGSNAKDRACNLCAVFTPRRPWANGPYILDMTVSNRSNDMIWGAYGANAVHFAMLHEFVAAATSMEVGVYTQVSANAHVYTDKLYGEKTWEAISEMASTATGWKVNSRLDQFVPARIVYLGDKKQFNVTRSIVPSEDNLTFEGFQEPPTRINVHNEYAGLNCRQAAILRGGWSEKAYSPKYLAELALTDEYKAQELREEVMENVLRGLRDSQNLESHGYKRVSEMVREGSHPDYIIRSISGPLSSPIACRVVVPMMVAIELHKVKRTHEAIGVLVEADKELSDYCQKTSNDERRIGLAYLGQFKKPPLTDLLGSAKPESYEHITLDWFRAGAQWLQRRLPVTTADGHTPGMVSQSTDEAISSIPPGKLVASTQSGNEWNK